MISSPLAPGVECWGGGFFRAGVLGILFFAAPLLRADVLANSDFSAGRAHWGGDAEEVASTDFKTGDAKDTAVTIKLKKDKWTMIYQSFTVRDPVLYYTIVFKLSKDYKLANAGSDDSAAADFSNVPGLMQLYDVPVGRWTLFYTGTDPADSSSIKAKHFDPDAKPGKVQTLTGKLIGLANGADANLILAFPPGKGSVMLKLLQLSRTDPNAQP
jgi:hypothetical protein